MRKRGRRDRWTRPLFAVTDPAASEATSTSIVNTFAGTLVTLTSSGNSQTIGDPSNPDAGRWFTFLNNDTSTDSIVVDGITIEPGEGVNFVWDGTAWLPVSDTTTSGSSGLSNRKYGVSFTESPDGVRVTFSITEDYIHTVVGKESVFYNGQRLKEGSGNDYVATESGGVGTGYDSIVMAIAPHSDAELLIDYVPDS